MSIRHLCCPFQILPRLIGRGEEGHRWMPQSHSYAGRLHRGHTSRTKRLRNDGSEMEQQGQNQGPYFYLALRPLNGQGSLRTEVGEGTEAHSSLGQSPLPSFIATSGRYVWHWRETPHPSAWHGFSLITDLMSLCERLSHCHEPNRPRAADEG